VRMSLISPNTEGYAYMAAMQSTDGPKPPEQLALTAAPGDEPVRLPALQLLKSLDDLDEEEDEDDDDIEDLDEEEDEDDLDEDYDDDDEDEDEEEEEEDDEDEDGGVKPLKMGSSPSGFSC
jgi:hypothetical protein